LGNLSFNIFSIFLQYFQIWLKMTIKLKAIAIQDWSEIYDLANTYRQQEQWQAAAIALQRTIELRPDFFWSHHHLGDVLSKLQQWQKAAQAYSEAVKLDPQFFWSWHNLGDVFSQLQQWDRASASYLQGI
jgi:tetratricopeptide (TPR) repeat protein